MIRTSLHSAGKRFCAFAVLLLTFCSVAAATNLTGTFKNPDGSLVDGKIIFLLSQPARLSDQSAQIVPMVKIFSVSNGALESGAFVYGNDVLVPGGTYYLVRLVDANNNLLFEQKWSISGTNLNLGTLTPTTTGVVFPDPLIKNSSSGQAVQGPVTFSAPLTAFSLTLSGNLNPGAADVYDLGNSSAPWQEIYAQRWNSLFSVGGSGGTALPPSAIPGAAVLSTGGSIGPGTYYFKVTYFNKNGETTASPARTVTIASGATNRIHIAPNDLLWGSGCYGYVVYASNDNLNFYAQTPSGSSADFQLSAPGGKTGHYVALGSNGARLDSLTFSGTPPPSTNTATIDPLQVALNRTMRQSDFAASQGALIVPVAFSGLAISAHTLTTPLIVPRYARITGTSHYGVGKQDAGDTRITGNWTDPKLAVVMTFGGFHSIENVTIYGPGHAVMLLAGVGYQAEAEIAKNSAFRTSDTTHTYAALKIVGVHFNIHHDNVYLRGDKAAILLANATGEGWTFSNVRWDLGGPNAINSNPGWTDPDTGAHNGSFPFGVSAVRLTNILIESGTGILWDCVGLGMSFTYVRQSDGAIVGGTDSIAKFGTDATYGGNNGPITLMDTSFGTSSNTRVGTNWVGTQFGLLNLIGQSSVGVGYSTGPMITIDLNNLGTGVINDFSSAGANNGAGSFDPNAASSTPHPINVSADTTHTRIGDDGKTSVDGWNEITSQLIFAARTGGTVNRYANLFGWRNQGDQFELNYYANGTKTLLASIQRLGLGGNWGFPKQVISTVATGTAPFSIASTTNVPNLNASSLNGATFAAPGAIGGGTPAAGTFTSVTAALYATTSNCSSAASPATCSAASAGSIVIAASATTGTVNTTAVTANSQIFLQEDSSLGTKLSVTCNTGTGRTYTVTARTASTSFAITASGAPTTNPACLSYRILN